MLYIIKKLLTYLIKDIDAGNSNLTEEDCLKLVNVIKEYITTDIEFSKYQAYSYLNISRAKFDNLVHDGILPKGRKVEGFKELRWSKKEIDECLRRRNENPDKGKQSDA